MLKGLSTAGVVTLALAGGCVDPKGEFEEYGTRVVDAMPISVDCPEYTETPDISGTFLFGSRDRIVTQMGDITFLFTMTMTRITSLTATVDVSAQPLDFKTKEKVGDPFVTTGIPVDTCLFKAPLKGTMPGASNPITLAPVEVDAVVPGEIQTTDFICGRTIEGGVPGFPLANQDFALIRVPEGAIGAALPDTKNNCDDAPAP
jgi:hypothetical protein